MRKSNCRYWYEWSIVLLYIIGYVSLFRARQKVKQRYLDIDGYGL